MHPNTGLLEVSGDPLYQGAAHAGTRSNADVLTLRAMEHHWRPCHPSRTLQCSGKQGSDRPLTLASHAAAQGSIGGGRGRGGGQASGAGRAGRPSTSIPPQGATGAHPVCLAQTQP